ncbi:MAG: hypothetical protein ACRDZN_17660 [Acidimicrobiales bacterium]
MLALSATDEARAALRAVRDRNPGLFAQISEQLSSWRQEPHPEQVGRAFRLSDDRTARLKLFYDHVERTDLALVWTVEDVAGVGTLTVVALEAVG